MEIRTEKGTVWGVVPARGGSKSIPLKNLHLLEGVPLVDYVIAAGRASKLDRVICTTDHDSIGDHCASVGVDVIRRPEELSSDQANVVDAVIHLLDEHASRGELLPEAVALLQPTSPFVLPEHINTCSAMIVNDPTLNSVQTVTQLPHNYHALNQRRVDDGIVSFVFPKERAKAYNKQTKPVHVVFGNLLITRTEAIYDSRNLFAPASGAVEIDPYHALDVDRAEDFELAEWYMSTKRVSGFIGS